MRSDTEIGFCDLRVSADFAAAGLHAFERLGYSTIALERRIDESAFERKKSKTGDPIPEPIDASSVSRSKLVVLNRITVQFSDPSIAHRLSQSDNLKKYDVIAVTPTSPSAFQAACSTMDIDVIAHEPNGSPNFKINRKLYRLAVERGVHFELSYASALRDSGCRKNLIQRAHVYRSFGGAANLLLSSGAENEFQVRAPHDVVNLSLILFLSEQQSKNVLTSNVKKVLLKSESRRHGKIPIFILHKNQANKRHMMSDSSIEIKRIKTNIQHMTK